VNLTVTGVPRLPAASVAVIDMVYLPLGKDPNFTVTGVVSLTASPSALP
jgi:hypothetical protein